MKHPIIITRNGEITTRNKLRHDKVKAAMIDFIMKQYYSTADKLEKISF